MSTPIPTPAAPEPERDPKDAIDWDLLDQQVFGDETDPEREDTTDAAVEVPVGRAEARTDPRPLAEAGDDAEEAARVRENNAWGLAHRLVQLGATPAEAVVQTHRVYPDIDFPDFEDESPAESVEEPMPSLETVPGLAVGDAADERVEDAADGDEAEEPAKSRPLTRSMKWVVGVVVALVVVLAGLGFIVSFDTQEGAVAPFLEDKAWMVPVGLDIGIIAFAALNLVLAYMNLSITWLRAFPWVLTAMSLYINVTAHDDLVARVAHVAMPGMWIVACEVGTHVVKIRAGLSAGTRTESLGLARWLLSPVTTLRLWRHMRLWGVKAAAKAREVESQRLEAKAALRYRYRAFWRFSAPVQLLTAYRLCKLTADEVYTWTPPAIVQADPNATQTATEQTTAADSDETDGQANRTDGHVNEMASEPHTSCTFREKGPADTNRHVAAAEKPDADEAETAAVPRPKRPRPAPAPPTPTPAPRLSDDEVIASLRELVAAEGEVSVKRARREFGLGFERAKRLIEAAARPAAETAID